MRIYDNKSGVERFFLSQSGRADRYAPREKIRVIEVSDFPTLGRFAALRFIEWLQRNEEGVVSLPTGKTPEHFISYTAYFLKHWNENRVSKELAECGIDPLKKPRMESYTFVQIDEFFPMDPSHENSFTYYIRKFYFKGLGFDPGKALLFDAWKCGVKQEKNLGEIFPDGRVDLSLRYRQPAGDAQAAQAKVLLAADQAAMEYEEKIAALGGIGFFLGGIGPDGHIGFNIRGSDHFSTTRITAINYETAAAAAVDLGGIEFARNAVVMTIGLRTITRNPTATAIIIAAGESKAAVVRDAVEHGPCVLYPATALQALDGACFYLTRGAAKLLSERRRIELEKMKRPPQPEIERVFIDIAVRSRKKLLELDESQIKEDRLGAVLYSKDLNIKKHAREIAGKIQKRIMKGTAQLENLTFLHTAPHHDDIMLGYLPYIVHLVRTPRNTHYFATLTSGFTSVRNEYALAQMFNLVSYLDSNNYRTLLEHGYFEPDNAPGRNRDVYLYLDGVAADNQETKNEAEAKRMLRNIFGLIPERDIRQIRRFAAGIIRYLGAAYPGQKDTPEIQTLKGMIREWEEELLWGHLGFNSDHIFHLRLPFYTGDIFTPQPEWGSDILPTLALIERLKPDVLTVALDPEASGPDTHYKVLQAISSALKEYVKKHPSAQMRIWGYRNIWHRFHPAEANVYVPVSMNSLAIMKSAFHTCFGSQRSASFPSYEYDGPFCNLAQKIMVEQYSMLKICLGRDFFYANPVPRLRASRGLCFLKEMTTDEFFDEAWHLRKITESVK